jgi:hypothetical protein
VATALPLGGGRHLATRDERRVRRARGDRRRRLDAEGGDRAIPARPGARRRVPIGAVADAAVGPARSR